MHRSGKPSASDAGAFRYYGSHERTPCRFQAWPSVADTLRHAEGNYTAVRAILRVVSPVKVSSYLSCACALPRWSRMR